MPADPESFSFRDRLRSLYFAMTGFLEFLREEHNARIHLVATIAVAIAAFAAKVTYNEAATLAIVIGIVWITEMLNTCVERIMDFVYPENHPQIKFIKDLAAGAVLAASFTAVIVGLLIFIPKFR